METYTNPEYKEASKGPKTYYFLSWKDRAWKGEPYRLMVRASDLNSWDMEISIKGRWKRFGLDELRQEIDLLNHHRGSVYYIDGMLGGGMANTLGLYSYITFEHYIKDAPSLLKLEYYMGQRQKAVDEIRRDNDGSIPELYGFSTFAEDDSYRKDFRRIRFVKKTPGANAQKTQPAYQPGSTPKSTRPTEPDIRPINLGVLMKKRKFGGDIGMEKWLSSLVVSENSLKQVIRAAIASSVQISYDHNHPGTAIIFKEGKQIAKIKIDQSTFLDDLVNTLGAFDQATRITPQTDPYTILGLRPTQRVTDEDVSRAFRAVAKKLHKDFFAAHNVVLTPEQQELITNVFIKIKQARSSLLKSVRF